MQFYSIRRFFILSLGLSIYPNIISCGGQGAAGDSAVVSSTTIKGVAMLGRVSGGTVSAYHSLPDGTADTKTGAIATASTDTDGNYALTISQTVIQSKETLVVRLEAGKGTYVEEATGNTVSVTTSMNAIVPLDDANKTNGATVQAALTPLTEVAAQNHFLEAGKAMMTQALKDPKMIPPEFKDKALAFQKAGFDPSFLTANPEFKAVFEAARSNKTFQDADFRAQMQTFATKAAFAVGEAFGVKNIVGTLPDNPKEGGKSQEGAGYMLAMAAISQQAVQMGKQTGTALNSMGMMQALGQQFAQNGHFNTPTAGANTTFTVRDANGKPVALPPPNFQDFSKAATQISTGDIKMPAGFVMFAPPTGTTGGSGGTTTTTSGTGGFKPSWGSFVPPTFNGTPSFTPPADFKPGAFTPNAPPTGTIGSFTPPTSGTTSGISGGAISGTSGGSTLPPPGGTTTSGTSGGTTTSGTSGATSGTSGGSAPPPSSAPPPAAPPPPPASH